MQDVGSGRRTDASAVGLDGEPLPAFLGVLGDGSDLKGSKKVELVLLSGTTSGRRTFRAHEST